MEAVSAAASLIAIGQAIAGIPKIVSIIQSITKTRKELEELLFELEILSALHDDVQMCFNMIGNNELPNMITPNEPAYIQRLKNELDSLMSQLHLLAADCEVAEKKHLPKRARVKWIWQKSKIKNLYEKARRIQDYVQRAVAILVFRSSLQHQVTQTKMLAEIHTVTTQKPHLPGVNTCNQVSKEYQYSQLDVGNKFSTYSMDPCTCDCHPRPHRSLIWTFFTQPRQSNVCFCTCSSTNRHYRANFLFPQWITQRLIEVTIYLGKTGIGVSLHLPVDRTYSFVWNIICTRNEEVACEWMIRNRISPSDVDRSGRSVLEYSVLHRQWAIVTYWLRHHSHIIRNTSASRYAAATALSHLKANRLTNRHVNDKVNYLCQSLVDLAEVEDMPMPVHTAIRIGGDLASALALYADTINDLDSTGEAALHVACRYQQLQALSLLISAGANIDVANLHGETPLHTAALLGLTDFMATLIHAGCNLECVEDSGTTPLLFALSFARADAIICLVSAGASIIHVSTSGVSVLHRLAVRVPSNTMPDFEMERVFALLMSSGAYLLLETKTDHEYTPLQLAIEEGNDIMIRLLVEAGARANYVNNHNGYNILHGSVRSCSHKILQYLRTVQIKELDIRSPNKLGETPLYMLQSAKHYDDFNYLFAREPSQDELNDFVCLLRDIRDRGIHAECTQLEKIISLIRIRNISKARERLKEVIGRKMRDKIQWEEDTFRAFDLDVRKGDLDLAILSIKEFMVASIARLEVSPLDEESDSWMRDIREVELNNAPGSVEDSDED